MIVLSARTWLLPVVVLVLALAGAVLWAGRRGAVGRGVRSWCGFLKLAGILVLAEEPHVLRVRLSGPLEARIEQAIARYGLTREEARREERANAGARAAWVQRFYGRDVTAPSLYDLVINATRFGVQECVALIVAAAASV